MATLPIVDWNAELVEALRDAPPSPGGRDYAALMMIDPFTLWEDLADLLKERGFAGVVNFPPASLSEGTQTAISSEFGNAIEIDRLKWFHENGLRLVYAASRPDEMAYVERRLAGLLDAFLHIPPEGLVHPIGGVLALESKDLPAGERTSGSPPVLSLKPHTLPDVRTTATGRRPVRLNPGSGTS